MTKQRWYSTYCIATGVAILLLSYDVVAETQVGKRLFLSPETITQLDEASEKLPIVLPDLGLDKALWLHYYGSIQKGSTISVLINQQWISKPTKVHGVMIVPQKISAMGSLPVNVAGDVLWLAPGQAIRLRDQWVE